MTITNTTLQSPLYAGNGVTVSFATGFQFTEREDISVILKAADGTETTLVLDTDYTVLGVEDPAGGVVTLSVAPAVGASLRIVRNLTLSQETDYIEGTAFPAETHENALDKLTQIAQQLAYDSNRAIKLPATSALYPMTFPDGGATKSNYVLRYNAAGNAIEAVSADDAFGGAAASPYIVGLFPQVDAAASRTYLGAQTANGNLTSIAALGTASDKLLYTTAINTWAEAPITAAGRALLDDADAAAQRTTLGLGTLATQNGTFSGFSSGNNTGDQAAFSTVLVGGQANVTAGGPSSNLEFVAGTNVTLTTDSVNSTVTISAAGGGGGGAPGGPNGAVQYNSASTFAGEAGFTYSAGALTVPSIATETLTVDSKVVIYDQAGSGVVAASSGDLYLSSTSGSTIISGSTDLSLQGQKFPNAAGTSGHVLTTNGTDASWQALPSSGSLVKIASATASSSASISFTGLSSTYSAYKVVMTGVLPGTTATSLNMRTSSNNGVSYDSGTSDYGYYAFANSWLNAASVAISDGANTEIILNPTSGGTGLVTTAANSLSGELVIFNPSSTVTNKVINWQGGYTLSGGGIILIGSGGRFSTAAINAIQFYMSSGNIASGTFTLYGVVA